MNNYAPYQFHYIAYLEDAGLDIAAIPFALQNLIQKAHAALASLAGQDINTQMEWLPILVQTDALICAKLYQWQPETFKAIPMHNKDSQLDKIKLLALKAKALQLKWDK